MLYFGVQQNHVSLLAEEQPMTETTTEQSATTGSEDIWAGMALMNPRNRVTKNFRTAVIADQSEAIQNAIVTNLRERLPYPCKIVTGDLEIEGRPDDCAGFGPGTPRWYVWAETQNNHTPSAGWRLVYEVEARPDVGLLWIHKICVAPDRASDAPENPYAD